jgi:outer membrane protein assembly factor BamB
VVLLGIAAYLYFSGKFESRTGSAGRIGTQGDEFRNAAIAFAGAPQEWPVFHGNSALTGYVDSYLPDNPNVLWKFNTSEKLPIKSSPVIGAGMVFVGSFDNSLYALNFKDGLPVWKVETGATIEGTPCYADGKVFVGSYDKFLYCFDARDKGKELWKFETGDTIKGGPNYISGPPFSSPKVIAGSYDNNLYCIDAQTGRKDWSFGTTNFINGTPALAGGKTVFGGCDGLLHVINLADGNEIKSIPAGAYIAASAAMDGDMAYVGHHENEFLAIDLQKGDVIWRFKSPSDQPFMSSPALTKDLVLVGCDDKMLHCLKRADGKPLWSFTAKGKITSSPVIAKDRVLFGDERGRVYLLALNDGAQIWTYEIGAPVDTTAAMANNVFIFGADDGSVTAFGKKE